MATRSNIASLSGKIWTFGKELQEALKFTMFDSDRRF